MRNTFLLKLTHTALLASASLSATAEPHFTESGEYALIGYGDEAQANPVARIQDELESGRLRLDYGEKRGYFDALLDALDIDPESQMLVFSATSLQKDRISPQTPRGLFFNDGTYLGLVQDSTIVEVATLDDELGIVFYTFDNRKGTTKYFERTNQTCLVCHDSQGTAGYGVPQLMALSSVYTKLNVPLESLSGAGSVGDATPIRDRWGGWYVTGRHGVQPHLGNLMLDDRSQLENLDDHRVWNLESLADAGYFDTSAYPRDTSDIVALMVLEHQITVQNQISYIKFKARGVLERREIGYVASAPSWDELPQEARQALQPMMDKLVERLVFTGAAEFASRISGSRAFVDDFVARGPSDPAGRSLRDLDLRNHLFRYPLSYLIYSNGFRSLPGYLKDYVYRRVADYLGDEGLIGGSSQYSPADRQAALEILTATEPEFRRYRGR